MEATLNIEPVIDLTASTTPESLRLNVEAELQIMENRERNQRRRSAGFADGCEVRVRVGFDYTPGVGWHTRDEARYSPMPKAEPEPVRWHGDHKDDEGFDDVNGIYIAVFTDVRTGEQTAVTEDGLVVRGNALDHPTLWTGPLHPPGRPDFQPAPLLP